MAKKPVVKKAAAKKPVVKAPAKKPAVVVSTRPAAEPKLSAIAQELVKAVGGLKQQKGETPAKFAERLCTAVSELSDEAYGKLSDAARKWFENAVEQINAEKKVELPTTAAAAAKQPAKAPAKAAPAATPRTEGVAHRVRSLVVDDPSVGFEDVAKEIGVEAKIGGHAWNIFNEAKRVMELVTARA